MLLAIVEGAQSEPAKVKRGIYWKDLGCLINIEDRDAVLEMQLRPGAIEEA